MEVKAICRPLSIGLVAFGLVLIIFFIIWALVIVPPMVKIPADLEETQHFEGMITTVNPQTQEKDEIPVKIERTQKATSVEDGVLIIEEAVVATHALAGVPLPDFSSTVIMGVDRSSREFVPGYGDIKEREGQFSFPDRVKKEAYPIWYDTARRTLDANFIAEEDYQGLRVYVFKIAEPDLAIGTDPQTGIPRFLDAMVDLKVEPVSGVTVYTKSVRTIKVMPQAGVKMPVLIVVQEFSDDTISEMVDLAQSSKTKLLWATSYGFWIGTGCGIGFFLLGLLGMVLRKRQAKA